VASGIILIQTIISCTYKPPAYFTDGKQGALPDSAKVKAVLSVSRENLNEKLSAVLFAVPNEKYRLELSGTFGLSAASILWKSDGWKIVMPQDERYMEGKGDCVFIPFYGGLDIHKFAALFFGQRVSKLDCGDFGDVENNLILEYRENAVYILSGTDTLKLEIKNIDTKAEWKSGVWNLNVPDGYVNLRY
jgi:hypothetical protein